MLLLPISKTGVLQSQFKGKHLMKHGLEISQVLVISVCLVVRLMLISPKTSDTSWIRKLKSVFFLVMGKMSNAIDYKMWKARN